MNSSDEDVENVLLLAVENQNNDIMYASNANDKEKASPAKLNVFKIYNKYYKIRLKIYIKINYMILDVFISTNW